MLGLGGFHIGNKAKLSDEESVKLIRHAVDQGITFLDNCWDYNEGLSEERMGKALQDGYRQRVFLMTKLDAHKADVALQQLEQSMKRLRTDHVDLVQIHEVIRATDPERCFAKGGVVEGLVKAREAGKLRYIGFTGHKHPNIHLAMLDEADKHGFHFDTVQMPLNVLDAHFRSFEREVLPRLVRADIGVLGMKSMGSGDVLKASVATAEECLRYALSLPTSVVISGQDSFEVLEKNLRVARSFKPFTDEERQALLDRTRSAAGSGEYEAFKTSKRFDGTEQNPHWLEKAEL